MLNSRMRGWPSLMLVALLAVFLVTATGSPAKTIATHFGAIEATSEGFACTDTSISSCQTHMKVQYAGEDPNPYGQWCQKVGAAITCYVPVQTKFTLTKASYDSISVKTYLYGIATIYGAGNPNEPSKTGKFKLYSFTVSPKKISNVFDTYLYAKGGYKEHLIEHGYSHNGGGGETALYTVGAPYQVQAYKRANAFLSAIAGKKAAAICAMTDSSFHKHATDAYGGNCASAVKKEMPRLAALIKGGLKAAKHATARANAEGHAVKEIDTSNSGKTKTTYVFFEFGGHKLYFTSAHAKLELDKYFA